MRGQRTAMPAHFKTSWLVLVCSCCLSTSDQAVSVSNAWREGYSPILNAREDFALTRMLFTYTDPGPKLTSTTLKMCSGTALTDTPADTLVTVVFGTPQTQEHSVEGKLVDDNFCAEFDMAYHVPDTPEPTTYTLVVDGLTLKTSTVVFPMTDVTVLSCDHRDLTRVSWTDPSTKIPVGCIANAAIPNVCYKEVDPSVQQICFKTAGTADMVVCRLGGAVVASDPGSQISVNYLAYDPATPDTASLSLLFNDDAEKWLEVTLWKEPDPASVLWCKGACTLPSFVPSNSVYEVCAFLKKSELGGPLSGFASVQDVKLVAYDMGEDPLFIEYGFINSNTPSRLYIASLFRVFTVLPPAPVAIATVHQDCVGVAESHTCIGSIAPSGLFSSDNMYVSVQYTDAAFANPTNRIAAKVQPLTAVGRNLSSIRDPGHTVTASTHDRNTDA